MYLGKKLHREISAVFCRLKMGKYAFGGNIDQIFRQIFVDEDDLILQRYEASKDLKTFLWFIVTYDTALPPFLEITTLLRMVDDERYQFAKAAHLLM